MCALLPATDLIDVPEEVGRIFVDPAGAGALELFAAVTSGQQAHAQRAGALRSQHVPDTVTDHQGALDPHLQSDRKSVV